MVAAADQDVIEAVAAKFQSGDLAGARADCGNFFTAVTDPAEVCFRRALAIDSRLATAHHGLGLHHLRHQQHALAARCFESAV